VHFRYAVIVSLRAAGYYGAAGSVAREFSNPAEAERLGVLAQEAIDQRWSTYEEMATRGAQWFPADARKDD
jgi:hypothetical protein